MLNVTVTLVYLNEYCNSSVLVPAAFTLGGIFPCFFCIPLTADEPQRARLPIPPTATLLSCQWPLRIFPISPRFSLSDGFLSRCKFNKLFLRTHVLILSATGARIQFLVFTRIELTTPVLSNRKFSTTVEHNN